MQAAAQKNTMGFSQRADGRVCSGEQSSSVQDNDIITEGRITGTKLLHKHPRPLSVLTDPYKTESLPAGSFGARSALFALHLSTCLLQACLSLHGSPCWDRSPAGSSARIDISDRSSAKGQHRDRYPVCRGSHSPVSSQQSRPQR